MIIELINRLITPLVLTGFAGGFVFVWLQFRELKSAGVIGFSYLIAATAFVLELLYQQSPPLSFARLMTDNIYLLSVMFSVIGIAMRYEKLVPWKILLLIYLGTVGFGYILYQAMPDLITKAYIISSGCSFMMAAALPLIRDHRHKKLDNLLFYFVMAASAQLMLNSALVFHADKLPTFLNTLDDAEFIAILNLTVVVISLCIAICLLLSYALEIIGELKLKSDVDALTKILNRGAFDTQARLNITLAHDQKLPFTMILADIDFFKKVNDTFGHAAGDEIIKSFSETLQSTVRVMDHTGRVGGEEFAILLPSARLEIGKEIAGAACVAFEAKDHQEFVRDLPITASFGVAELRENESYYDLFKRADEALYMAKNSGRNRVALASDVSEVVFKKTA